MTLEQLEEIEKQWLHVDADVSPEEFNELLQIKGPSVIAALCYGVRELKKENERIKKEVQKLREKSL